MAEWSHYYDEQSQDQIISASSYQLLMVNFPFLFKDQMDSTRVTLVKTLFKPKHDISFKVARLADSPEPIVGSRFAALGNLLDEPEEAPISSKVSLDIIDEILGNPIKIQPDDNDDVYCVKKTAGGVIQGEPEHKAFTRLGNGLVHDGLCYTPRGILGKMKRVG